MILSILDTDLYKFSTSNAYFHLYPLAEGTFKFNDRAAEVYDAAFLSALKEEFEHLGRLRLTDAEFDYITRKIRYINRNYWEWLRGFHFDPSKIDIKRMHEVWDRQAHEHGLDGFHFFALCIGSVSLKWSDKGHHYDSLVLDPLLDSVDAWQYPELFNLDSQAIYRALRRLCQPDARHLLAAPGGASLHQSRLRPLAPERRRGAHACRFHAGRVGTPLHDSLRACHGQTRAGTFGVHKSLE